MHAATHRMPKCRFRPLICFWGFVVPKHHWTRLKSYLQLAKFHRPQTCFNISTYLTLQLISMQSESHVCKKISHNSDLLYLSCIFSISFSWNSAVHHAVTRIPTIDSLSRQDSGPLQRDLLQQDSYNGCKSNRNEQSAEVCFSSQCLRWGSRRDMTQACFLLVWLPLNAGSCFRPDDFMVNCLKLSATVMWMQCQERSQWEINELALVEAGLRSKDPWKDIGFFSRADRLPSTDFRSVQEVR